MKLPRSRMSLRDLGAEAAAGVMQRPARSALTAVGTVLGVGALIAVTGLTSTAASQIDARFNQLTATEVTVDDIGPSLPGQPGPAFPADADARVERLHGVTAAGVSWHVRLQPGQVIASGPPGAAYAVTDRQAQLTAVSAGALRAVGPTLQQGRVYDKFHEEHRQRVAVLGSATASRLGITNLQGQPAVFIGSTSFVVIGILADVQRRPDLLTSVIIPRASAQDLWGRPSTTRPRCSSRPNSARPPRSPLRCPSLCVLTTPTTCVRSHRPTPVICGPGWRTTSDSSSSCSRPSVW